MITKILTFLYHEVTDHPELSGFQRQGALPYKHGVNKFLSDLDAIALEHVKASSIFEAVGSQKTSLVMTFDDGGVSAIQIAELLEKRGWLGHFFVTTSLIGKAGFLTEGEIRNLDNRGHIIGSHSHTHPDIFRDIPYKQKIEEWRVSKEKLEEILRKEILCASVPGGDMDDDTIKSAAEAGIKYLFTSEPSYSPYEKYGVLVIGRVCAKNTTTTKQVHAWAKGEGFVRARFVRFCKEIIRTILHPVYQGYVRINERKI